MVEPHFLSLSISPPTVNEDNTDWLLLLLYRYMSEISCRSYALILTITKKWVSIYYGFIIDISKKNHYLISDTNEKKESLENNI